jgi:hypothetical protein
MTVKIPNSLLYYRQFSIVWWIALPAIYHRGHNTYPDVYVGDWMSLHSEVVLLCSLKNKNKQFWQKKHHFHIADCRISDVYI